LSFKLLFERGRNYICTFHQVIERISEKLMYAYYRNLCTASNKEASTGIYIYKRVYAKDVSDKANSTQVFIFHQHWY